MRKFSLNQRKQWTLPIWDEALKHFRTRLNPASFNTWFSPTKQIAFQQNILRIAVPNQYFIDWLGEYYLERILETLKAITGNDVKVRFVITENLTRTQGYRPKELPRESLRQAYPSQKTGILDMSPVPLPSEQDALGLNPQYTFDTYVVGENNRFAYAASRTVAEHPAQTYNPLFIYGGNGLGKTHLLHAIGHAFENGNRPGGRLCYVSFGRFMHELLDALGDNSMQQFHEKYRNLDLLLFDDIQSISGKECAQEEFCHIFNALYNAQKQIVISSDRPPKKIPSLEERLRSRFEWGLLADIHPPKPEMKIAIKKKAVSSF